MKLALVNFIGWRVGSSMVTGLLGQAGAALGVCDVKPTPHNLLGHFENVALRDFQHRRFWPHWFWMHERLTVEKMCEIAKNHHDEFASICKNEFDGFDVAATKCMTGSLIPNSMLWTNDVRVIWLRRNLENQARSITKLREQKNCVNPSVVKWLEECEGWMRNFFEKTAVKYCDISFDRLLATPVVESGRMADFLEIEISEETVRSWIVPAMSRSTV